VQLIFAAINQMLIKGWFGCSPGRMPLCFAFMSPYFLEHRYKRIIKQSQSFITLLDMKLNSLTVVQEGC